MDIDEKLYKEYLNGNKDAFETLYLKYKEKIKYFVFNIVKDYEKAEDITQDVFISILNNKYNENEGSLKYYIYMVAKNKAITYLNTENRRNNITEKYLNNPIEDNQNDVLISIIKEENKREIIDAINLINEKYRNAIYLVKIEEFSYQEVANILNVSIQDVKNFVHRGKKELRKILIKKGFDDMSKTSKIIVSVLVLCILITGSVYAVKFIYEKIQEKATIVPTLTSELSDNNDIWVGTFQIAWNKFMDERVGGKVEFIEGNTKLVDELNKRLFTEDMISSEDYYIKIGETTEELKEEISRDINEKFGITNSPALNEINFNPINGYTIYSMLYKKLNFLTPFDRIFDMNFNGSEEKVKYFGINNASSDELRKNVEVLFYNNSIDFAVKLKTKENEEVILYSNNTNSSFTDLYKELSEKTEKYIGERNLLEDEELCIPYINIDTNIEYKELCNKYLKYQTNESLKGKPGWIAQAIQNVNFSLNEQGSNLISEATIRDEADSIGKIRRNFNYTGPFVIFLKEYKKEKPYFALKVDNIDVLVESDLK